jgi:hypothetical protein
MAKHGLQKSGKRVALGNGYAYLMESGCKHSESGFVDFYLDVHFFLEVEGYTARCLRNDPNQTWPLVCKELSILSDQLGTGV